MPAAIQSAPAELRTFLSSMLSTVPDARTSTAGEETAARSTIDLSIFLPMAWDSRGTSTGMRHDVGPLLQEL